MAERSGIVNFDDVPEEVWQEGKFGGREQDLGKAAGSARIGLRREVLPPGKQSSPSTPTWSRRSFSWCCGGRERSCGARSVCW